MGICPSRVTPEGCRCVWNRFKTQALCLCWWRRCCLFLLAACQLAPPNYRDLSTATRSVKQKHTFLHTLHTLHTCLFRPPTCCFNIYKMLYGVISAFKQNSVLGTSCSSQASEIQYYAYLTKICSAFIGLRAMIGSFGLLAVGLKQAKECTNSLVSC